MHDVEWMSFDKAVKCGVKINDVVKMRTDPK